MGLAEGIEQDRPKTQHGEGPYDRAHAAWAAVLVEVIIGDRVRHGLRPGHKGCVRYRSFPLSWCAQKGELASHTYALRRLTVDIRKCMQSHKHMVGSPIFEDWSTRKQLRIFPDFGKPGSPSAESVPNFFLFILLQNIDNMLSFSA
jgi:hypothetical protein